MSDSGDAVLDLQNDILSAVRLQSELQLLHRDRMEADRIIFAVDASLLYTAIPSPEGPNSRYPDYFRGPSTQPALLERCAEADRDVRAVVAWFLLSEFGKDKPLLLLPGHDIEGAHFYDRVVSGFLEQGAVVKSATSEATRLESIWAEISSSRLTQHMSDQSVEQVTANLFKLLYRVHLPHFCLKRANALVRGKRVMNLQAASRHSAFRQPALLFNGKHIFGDLVSEREKRAKGSKAPGTVSWWNSRLVEKVPKRFRKFDKYALATLDVLNRALSTHGRKCVLFTSNEAILAAGSEYFPRKSDADDPDSHRSFSELYLRNPRGLLFSEGLAQDSGQQLDLGASIGWLEALIPVELRGGSSGSVDRERVALDRYPDVHSRLINNWVDYLESLSSRHATVSALANASIRLLFGDGQNRIRIDGLVDRINSRVKRMVEESWSDFFNTAADTGFEFVRAEGTPAVRMTWAVPLLVFRGSGDRPATLERLWDARSIRSSGGDSFAIIQELRSKAGLENAYIVALAFGVLFAYFGRWELCKLLSERGIQIARSLRELPVNPEGSEIDEGVDGREAWYLRAVAARVMARNAEDLAEASRALTAARECQDRSRQVHSMPRITGIRFLAEEVSIQLAQLSFDSQVDGDRGHWALISTVSQVHARIVSALAQAHQCTVMEVRRHAEVRLRTEYFFGLSMMVHVTDGWNNVVMSVSETLAPMVRAQLDSIVLMYGSELAGIPARDAVLLRFAAVLSGQIGVLPKQFTIPVFRNGRSVGQRDAKNESRDSTMLGAIEDLISRLQVVKGDADKPGHR